MISASRAYIKQQILKCNADYKEINDPFGSDDISLSLIDNSYKMLFGPLSTEAVGNFHTDLVECTLEIYKKSGFDDNSDFDSIYDLAINVRNEIINPLFVKNSDDFTDIIFLGIVPEALPSNDKVFKILLTFQIRKDFDFQGA